MGPALQRFGIVERENCGFARSLPVSVEQRVSIAFHPGVVRMPFDAAGAPGPGTGRILGVPGDRDEGDAELGTDFPLRFFDLRLSGAGGIFGLPGAGRTPDADGDHAGRWLERQTGFEHRPVTGTPFFEFVGAEAAGAFSGLQDHQIREQGGRFAVRFCPSLRGFAGVAAVVADFNPLSGPGFGDTGGEEVDVVVFELRCGHAALPVPAEVPDGPLVEAVHRDAVAGEHDPVDAGLRGVSRRLVGDRGGGERRSGEDGGGETSELHGTILSWFKKCGGTNCQIESSRKFKTTCCFFLY